MESHKSAPIFGWTLIATALLLLTVSCGEDAPPEATAGFTVDSFLLERAENIRRFDDTYQGEWVLIIGIVWSIDRDVYIKGTTEVRAELDGLPDEIMDRLNAGDLFAAVCKYDKYGYEYIFLKNCTVESPDLPNQEPARG